MDSEPSAGLSLDGSGPQESDEVQRWQDSLDVGPASSMLARLTELIRRNGRGLDDMRGELQPTPGETFSADLVVREDNGFELWLGSLDDALSVEALRSQGVNAILNCAWEDCEKECAPFRVVRGGRRRSHARGASAMTAPLDEKLDRDQVRALALFDGSWYSDMLGYDVPYLGLAANDEAGYAMDAHFPDVVAFLEESRRGGRRVLVHCIMGINRSSAALVAFICEGLGLSLEEAVTLVSERRGYVLSNESFLLQLIKRYGQRSEESGTLRLGADNLGE